MSKPSAAADQERAANLCGGPVVGVGLRGEYFADPHWTGRLLASRLDANIEFVTGFELPAQAPAAPVRSARWTGWVKAPYSGRYRFHAQPAHAQVMVSRQLIAGPGAADDAGVDMVAGRFLPIEVRVAQMEPAAQALVQLEWTPPHGVRFVVPKAVLNPPTDTVLQRN